MIFININKIFFIEKDYKVSDHLYQILIQPSESLELELVFSPTEVFRFNNSN